MTEIKLKPFYWDRTFFLVMNNCGDLTGDEDLETAIKRMENDFGGERTTYRVVEMQLKVPRPGDYLEKLIAHLPDEERSQILLDLSKSE